MAVNLKFVLYSAVKDIVYNLIVSGEYNLQVGQAEAVEKRY